MVPSYAAATMIRVLLALALSCACGPNKAKPVTVTAPSAPVAMVVLTFDVKPADAEVEVDGAPRGKASEIPTLELAPGPHQIVISKKGFEVWRGEVSLETDPETIQVRLVKQ